MRKWFGVALVAAFVMAPVLVAASPAAARTLPPGVTVVSTPSIFSSNSPQTAEAKCPAGKRVLGGGVRVNAGIHVIVTRQEPISTVAGDSYLVTAEEDAVGTTTTWSVQALAICSDPIPGLRIVSAISPTQSGHFTSVDAECPAATNLLGTGGRILDGQGRVDLSTLVQGGQLNPHGAIAAGSEGFTDFPGNWSVIAFAVCAPVGINDIRLVQNFGASSTVNPKILTATCPAGMTITGGTGFVDIPGVIASVNVDAFRTRIQVIGKVNDTSVTGSWALTAMAICVA
jgi:hypothetical protein